MLTRRILLGSIAAPAVVLTAVSLAWACVPQASFVLNPTEGAAGAQVAASGSDFESGPVELRWESRTGPILATATGPSFNNVSITIPANAEPGVHYVSAANTGEHATHGATAASFEVKGAAPPPAATSPPPAQQPAPNPPAPPADPGNTGPSPRAVAIKKCKRKYSVKGVKSASKKRRMTKKRNACIKRAKRLSNSNSSAAFNNVASLPLFGKAAAGRG